MSRSERCGYRRVARSTDVGGAARSQKIFFGRFGQLAPQRCPGGPPKGAASLQPSPITCMFTPQMPLGRQQPGSGIPTGVCNAGQRGSAAPGVAVRQVLPSMATTAPHALISSAGQQGESVPSMLVIEEQTLLPH
jgi:hypothetical protein